MTDSPNPAAQTPLSAIAGAQVLGVLAICAIGLAAGYLGLLWVAKSSAAVSFNPATLGLAADGVAYTDVLISCWFVAAKPSKGS